MKVVAVFNNKVGVEKQRFAPTLQRILQRRMPNAFLSSTVTGLVALLLRK
jgi:hypothetical protein